MTARRGLATLAVVLLILIAGIALLYAVRSEGPPTRVFHAPSSTPTVTPPLVTTTPLPVATSTAVNVCGPFHAEQAASGTRNAVLAMGTQNGAMNFELVGAGTMPANLGRDPSLPEILRLTGRRVDGTNTLAVAVADYNVVRVAGCT